MGFGEVVQHKPLCFQMAGAERQIVEGRYVLIGDSTVGFEIARYDRRRSLVIDPTIVYSAAIGASAGIESIRGIATDRLGNTYITGTTQGLDFPTLSPFQTMGQIFIAKLNATGTGLVYATYLGGSGSDSAAGIAVDNDGNAVITGTTYSSGSLLRTR
jgi:hypothetical protein